jgi:hypothetical protein
MSPYRARAFLLENIVTIPTMARTITAKPM